MNRFLAILLLLLLPLQSSAALLGGYCEHESGPRAQHFGHHEHEHSAADAADAQDGGDSKLPSFHADCGQCHGSHAVAFLTAPALTTTDLAGAMVAGTRSGARAPVPAPPERPNWARFA